MKRRFANSIEGDYFQERIDNDYFKGYACFIKIKNVKKPLIVYNGITNICIKDENYEWIEVYPENEKYAITIMFDDNDNLIEWYFDIAKNMGLENGIPFEDDLYLDMIITPAGEKRVIDENELKEAFNNDEITQEDLDSAYQTLELLENKYVNNLDELVKFTNYLCDKFKSKSRVLIKDRK